MSSAPKTVRTALLPQRSHGRARFAALLEAGAAVIAEQGYQAATMAEIAARAKAPIGSLYRFFPTKEILADALITRFSEQLIAALEAIDAEPKSLSIDGLSRRLISVVAHLRGERLAVRALLEAHRDWSERREQFRNAIVTKIAHTLTLRRPGLAAATARTMATLLMQNVRADGVLTERLKGEERIRALDDLHEMTRLYIEAKFRKVHQN